MSGMEGARAAEADWTSTLIELVCEVAHFAKEDVTPDVHLVELGLDSLMLMSVVRSLEARHGAKLKLGQIFEELHTIRSIAAHLEQLGLEPSSSAPPSGVIVRSAAGVAEPEAASAAPMNASGALGNGSQALVPAEARAADVDLLSAQLQLMERLAGENVRALQAVIAEQLAVRGAALANRAQPVTAGAAFDGEEIPRAAPLMSGASHGSAPPATARTPRGESAEGAPAPGTPAPARRSPATFRAMQLRPAKGLSDAQRAFVDDVSARFQRRTPGSKQRTAEGRPVLADWKQTFSFWSQFKEAKYPIVSARSSGARFWDVDDNEYIDIAMGMGVHLFGHNPKFIVDALHDTLATGMELGTQCRLTSEVARTIHELTGVERVAFSNTGTEAVMVCLRLARAATGRDKVVLFDNSYHGIFDGVLGALWQGRVEPIGPGTPKAMVADLIVLEYGAPESLRIISERAGEIAAVLVEPVQSRNPDLQPQSFLRRLRQLTREKDVALIFDEMITGFRCHPGGAQALLGIDADIVAYGKVAGGGLPIGVVAGKSRYLDYIDGGSWQYGDSSGPRSELIFFGGTFGRNPMTMTAAHAALRELVRRGPELHAELNARTTAFVDRLNAWLERHEVPLRVKHFASQFRIVPTEETSDLVHPIELELLYLCMSLRGVYTWERRICFFSTEHGPAEIETVFRAITQSIEEIRAAGFPFREQLPHRRQFSPVTTEQQRLYALCQHPGAEGAYHLPSALWIDGPLDADRLELAFADVIARHEGLRTSFHVIDGELLQKVHDHVRFALSRERALESEIAERLEKFSRPFELDSPPLLRAALLEVAPERHLLVVDAHHISVDGRSFDVMAAELMALYQGAALSPVEFQLRDVVALRERARGPEKVREDREFWTGQLGGELPVLELPGDRPRGARRDFAGGHVLSRIPPETTRRLKALAREQGVSLYMLLLGAYAALLHRLSGQEDLCIGAPTAGRPSAELEGIVGMLTNSIVIRLQPRSELEFGAFLRHVQTVCGACYDHADYPFAELWAALSSDRERVRARTSDRNPLFDTMLSYERADARSFRIADLKFSRADMSAPGAMLDLNLDIIEEADHLYLDFGYAKALFDRATVERWSQHFECLLAGVLSDPRQRLDELPLLGAEQRSELLSVWSGRDAAYPERATLAQLFAARARELPENPALIDADGVLTYSELHRRASSIANQLQAAGVEPGDFVGVLLPPSSALVAALLGVLYSGAAYVPLDPSYPIERLRFMLEDSGARVVLTDASCRERLPEAARAGREVLLDASPRQEPTVTGELPEIDPDAPAYVIYTSGSSGQPKGCVISHRNVVRLLVNDAFEFDFGPSDTWIVCHSFCFDFSVWEMYGALLHGGRLVVPTREQVRDPELLLGLLARHRVTVLNQTPAAFENLIHAELRRREATLAEHLRLVIFGGDRLEGAALRPWVARYPLDRVALINMYGITETTVHVTRHRVTSEDVFAGEGRSRVGRPLPDTRVYVCNSRLEPQPIGVAGELLVGGGGVGQGYLRRPELTREKFLQNPFGPGRLYRSGDLGRWLPDGTLEHLGRLDQQIQLHGFRIEPAEVAQALLGHAEVRQAFVTTAPHAGTITLVAYVVLAAELDALALREHLLTRLPAHMVPSHFIRLQALPTTSNGKVDRRALPAPGGPSGLARRPHAAAQTAAERAVSEVLASVLRVPAVSLDDDYYALGGDSIQAIFVASALQQRGFTVSVADVLGEPSVRALSRRLSHTPPAAAQGTAASQGAELPTRPAPLSPIQRWFFEHHHTDRHHYAHWVTLESRERLDIAALSRALELVVAHHDQLRAHFAIDPTGETTQQVSEPGPIELEVTEEREARAPSEPLEQRAARLASRLDLEAGPLLRCGLWRLSDVDQLTIVVHHLVIDAVSWRILLDDLARAYAAESAGEPPALPPKTAAYVTWARAQHELSPPPAASGATSAHEPSMRLPLAAHQLAPATYGNIARSALALTPACSRELFDVAQGAGSGPLEAVLLAAFALALSRWSGSSTLRMLLEGHGREGDLDVARTVGWFTRLEGWTLEVPSDHGMNDVIHQVRSRRGAGGGLARPRLAPHGAFSIAFNYLGDVSAHGASGIFRPCASGASNAERLERPTLIDLDACVRDGRLELELAFDRVLLAPRDMRRLLHDVRDLLLDWVEARSADALPASGPSAAALGLDVEGVERIAPCSPLQEGILFHALMEDGERDPSYFEQLGIELVGEIDERSLRDALTLLVARHGVLRTTFVHDHPPRPLQIVWRNVEIPFETLDLRGMSDTEQRRRIEELRQRDRRLGFDLARGPLVRVTLVRLEDQRQELCWSHHHILLDGWSLGVLFEELLSVHAALRSGRPPELDAALPYTAYIEWLERRDAQASLDYYRSYLEGYERLASLPRLSEPAAAGDFDHREVARELSPDRSRALSARCRRLRVTLNTLVQSAWALVLARESGAPDVVFGSVVSSRPVELEHVERAVGLFLQTLPVRVRVQSGEELAEVAIRMQRDAAQSAPHAWLALSQIQELTRVEPALLDHVVVFESYPIADALRRGLGGASDLAVGRVEAIEHMHYDFSLIVEPRESIELRLVFNARRVDAERCRRVLAALFDLLSSEAEREDGAERELAPPPQA